LPGSYTAITHPIASRRDAFKVCQELNELEEADYSELTRKSVLPSPPPAYRI
jgi:hypothetical protein